MQFEKWYAMNKKNIRTGNITKEQKQLLIDFALKNAASYKIMLIHHKLKKIKFTRYVPKLSVMTENRFFQIHIHIDKNQYLCYENVNTLLF